MTSNTNNRGKLSQLLNRILNQNDSKLDPNSRNFRELRQLMKTEPGCIQPFVALALKVSSASECPERTVVLEILDHFFHRSHAFRLAVEENLQEVLHLYVEIDPLHRPLPPPRDEANELKMNGIKKIKVWHEKFAAGYNRLAAVASFLSLSKSVDYERASASLLAERKRNEELEQQQREKANRIASIINEKFALVKSDIERVIKEVQNGLRILVPVFMEEETPSTSGSFAGAELNKSSDIDKSLHGYTQSETITVVIDSTLPKVEVSPNNDAVVCTVNDARIMMDYHRKQLNKWLARLSEGGCSSAQVAELISLKQRLDAECQRVDELKLPKRSAKRIRKESDSEGDSDLEDVPEKEVEDIPLNLYADDVVPEHILKRIRDVEREKKHKSTVEFEADQQPGCSKWEDKESSNDAVPVDNELKRKKNEIPVVPFGLDIKYWGNTPKGVEVPKNNADCHRFWRAPDENDTSIERESVYTSRVFTYVGEGVKATKACRARLSNGELCPRMDVHRCPLHGVIVDRDDEGFPISQLSEDQAVAVNARLVREAEKEEDDYIRDIEAATGRSLAAPVKKRSKKRVREVPESKAVRERLEKKLLDKRTVARVSATLDAVRKAKIEKKFGHQFVHAFTRK